jgi:hypothetical protein
MVAVGRRSLPLRKASHFRVRDPIPQPGDRDLLCGCRRFRQSGGRQFAHAKQGTEAEPVILGWDAAGIVERRRDCSLFSLGTMLTTPATSTGRYQRTFPPVDERIVGRKPKSLDFAEAAALPLTTLTAWELMFDRIGVKRGEGADRRSLLIVGGAGASVRSPSSWRASSRASPSSPRPHARRPGTG